MLAPEAMSGVDWGTSGGTPGVMEEEI